MTIHTSTVAVCEDAPAEAGSYGQAGAHGQQIGQQLGAGGWRQLEDNAQWMGPSSLECASMEGRRAVIDVDHYPTAMQVCASPGSQEPICSWLILKR